MIYQYVNKRTKSLPLATSHIAHLCSQFNHVSTANFYATFKSINFFIKIAPKIRYFCKKKRKIIKRWAPPPDHRASGGWGATHVKGVIVIYGNSVLYLM